VDSSAGAPITSVRIRKPPTSTLLQYHYQTLHTALYYGM
jgi:hypothetical protein